MTNLIVECAICLNGDGDFTTACGHKFHMSCLITWKEENGNGQCPCCRSEIEYKRKWVPTDEKLTVGVIDLNKTYNCPRCDQAVEGREMSDHECSINLAPLRENFNDAEWRDWELFGPKRKCNMCYRYFKTSSHPFTCNNHSGTLAWCCKCRRDSALYNGRWICLWCLSAEKNIFCDSCSLGDPCCDCMRRTLSIVNNVIYSLDN